MRTCTINTRGKGCDRSNSCGNKNGAMEHLKTPHLEKIDGRTVLDTTAKLSAIA
jgi:hypothetical protein